MPHRDKRAWSLVILSRICFLAASSHRTFKTAAIVNAYIDNFGVPATYSNKYHRRAGSHLAIIAYHTAVKEKTPYFTQPNFLQFIETCSHRSVETAAM